MQHGRHLLQGLCKSASTYRAAPGWGMVKRGGQSWGFWSSSASLFYLTGFTVKYFPPPRCPSCLEEAKLTLPSTWGKSALLFPRLFRINMWLLRQSHRQHPSMLTGKAGLLDHYVAGTISASFREFSLFFQELAFLSPFTHKASLHL